MRLPFMTRIHPVLLFLLLKQMSLISVINYVLEYQISLQYNYEYIIENCN